jgi:hypothetical protein
MSHFGGGGAAGGGSLTCAAASLMGGAAGTAGGATVGASVTPAAATARLGPGSFAQSVSKMTLQSVTASTAATAMNEFVRSDGDGSMAQSNAGIVLPVPRRRSRRAHRRQRRGPRLVCDAFVRQLMFMPDGIENATTAGKPKAKDPGEIPH